MDELFLHIRYLLRSHECVNVPGFGAFMATRHPASYDAGSGCLLPPWREFSFNALITNNDGILANSIARRNHISFEEASRTLSEHVAALHTSLQQDGEMAIPRLGKLILGEENRIVFRPSSRKYDQLGFTPVKVSRDNEPRQESSGNTRNVDLGKYYLVPRRLVHYCAASLMLAIVVVSAVLFARLPQESGNMQKASVVPIEKIEKIVTEGAKAMTVADTVVAKKAQAEEPHMHVVVAAFRSAAEAHDYIDTHKESGYDLEVLSTKTMHRVSAVSSNDKEELQSVINTPGFTDEFPGAWIYTK